MVFVTSVVLLKPFHKMKTIKVITTVGTSLIENAKKGHYLKQVDDEYSNIKKAEYYQSWKSYFENGTIDTVKEAIRPFFEKNYADISAEIKSLVLIQAQEKCKLEVYLICTDTILSVVAADMIKEYFATEKYKANFEIRFEHNEAFIIKDLAVDDFQKFDTEGVNNLINSIYNFLKEDLFLRKFVDTIERVYEDEYYNKKESDAIKEYYKKDYPQIWEVLKNNALFKSILEKEKIPNAASWVNYYPLSTLIPQIKEQQIYLNISGGFKAMIPYTSLMGQLYDLRLAYVFDDEKSEMIFIDKMPINFDLSLAEQYAPYLDRVDNFGEETEIFKLFQKQKLVRSKNGKTELTVIGTLLKEFITLNASTYSRSWGIFAEYKILEYYYENPYKQNPTTKHSKYVGKEEIDIEITSGNEIFAFEIKSFFQPANTIDKIINSANNRIDLYNQLFPNQLKEYNLIIYKTQFDDLSLVDENLKKLRDACKAKNVICKAFYIQIQLDEKGNAYQRFMQKPIKNGELIEILIQN